MTRKFTRFLQPVRERECEEVLKFIQDKRFRVLEIGGGKGHQASYMAKLGFDITSIDIEENSHWSKDDRVFPIITYDGENIPFPDDSFDFIFTSQVLEHIGKPDFVHGEMKRVLKQGGEMVHLVPSGWWAFWNCVLCPASRFRMIFRRIMSDDRKKYWYGIKPLLKFLFIPLPRSHGDNRKTIFGAVGEIWTFSFRSWTQHLEEQNYAILESRPLGLFYTGYSLFGLGISFRMRKKLSRFFGSATLLFRTLPKGQA